MAKIIEWRDAKDEEHDDYKLYVDGAYMGTVFWSIPWKCFVLMRKGRTIEERGFPTLAEAKGELERQVVAAPDEQ